MQAMSSAKRALIIQGHPDPKGARFCHALADSYAEGARQAGLELRRIDVATLAFEMLRSKEEWESGAPSDVIRGCQEDIRWAAHLVIVYPLWLGAMPALLKGFFEQVFRPGFAICQVGEKGRWRKLLKGKSARIVVTMGMPALRYRWYFGAHSLKSQERNILGFCGIGPIHESLIGMVESRDESRRRKWLRHMHKLGARAL
jgi:putative NADPH-quinone reductase